ncbi:unnamed protein product [Urochloa humidicola]
MHSHGRSKQQRADEDAEQPDAVSLRSGKETRCRSRRSGRPTAMGWWRETKSRRWIRRRIAARRSPRICGCASCPAPHPLRHLHGRALLTVAGALGTLLARAAVESSLVVALATEQFLKNVPKVMPPHASPLTTSLTASGVHITIINTSSSLEQKPKFIVECRQPMRWCLPMPAIGLPCWMVLSVMLSSMNSRPDVSVLISSGRDDLISLQCQLK